MQQEVQNPEMTASRTSLRKHNYGTVFEGSDCNMLINLKEGEILIAPFHNQHFRHQVLLWNPYNLQLLKSTNGDIVYKLWDNLYAVFHKNLTYFDDLHIYGLQSKGFKRIKISISVILTPLRE